jgi:hypothetical protein
MFLLAFFIRYKLFLRYKRIHMLAKGCRECIGVGGHFQAAGFQTAVWAGGPNGIGRWRNAPRQANRPAAKQKP